MSSRSFYTPLIEMDRTTCVFLFMVSMQAARLLYVFRTLLNCTQENFHLNTNSLTRLIFQHSIHHDKKDGGMSILPQFIANLNWFYD